MKNLVFKLLAIIILTSFTHAQPIAKSFQLSWPSELPSFYYNGKLYSVAGPYASVFSISTGQAASLSSLVTACNSVNADFLITPQGEFFCYPEGNNPATSFPLVQFDPDNYSTIATYTYNGSILSSYAQTDNYITYVSQAFNQKSFSLSVFDTLNDKYVCKSSLSGPIAQHFIYFIGIGTLYQLPNNDDFIEFVPCNSQSTIQTPFSFPAKDQNWVLSTLNQSSVNILSWESLDGDNYGLPVYFDLTGVAHFGTISEVVPLKFNDTHFFSSFVQNNFWSIGLFTVNPSLQVTLVAQMNTMILGSYDLFGNTISSIVGGPCVAYAFLSEISGFSYNFDDKAYENTFPDFGPFQLANGSYINLTEFGYFIQSPGEEIYFINIPYNSYYQDSSNPGVIWTIFVPTENSESNNYTYQDCVLLQFNISSSLIASTLYPSCPKNTGGYLSSVSFDSENNPVALFIMENLYMIQKTGFKQLVDLAGYSSVQSVINIASGIGSFVGMKGSKFVFNNFEISSGVILNSSSIALINEGLGSFVQILTGFSGQYYLLGSSTFSSSAYLIWDVINQKQVYGFQANLTFIFEEKTPNGIVYNNYPIIGVNIVPNNQTPHGYVIIGYKGSIEVISLNDNSYNINSQNILQITQVDESGIWVLEEGGFSSTWTYFTINT